MLSSKPQDILVILTRMHHTPSSISQKPIRSRCDRLQRRVRLAHESLPEEVEAVVVVVHPPFRLFIWAVVVMVLVGKSCVVAIA